MPVSRYRIELWTRAWHRKARQTVTDVWGRFSFGGYPTKSRDLDDNLMLATASAGKAKFFITNDRDLLDIPAIGRRKFRFAIVTPVQFLEGLKERLRRE